MTGHVKKTLHRVRGICGSWTQYVKISDGLVWEGGLLGYGRHRAQDDTFGKICLRYSHKLLHQMGSGVRYQPVRVTSAHNLTQPALWIDSAIMPVKFSSSEMEGITSVLG